jgi:hypothetical protein
MKIALLCPVRERIENLKRLIHSLIKTTSTLENIVLVLGIDDDDPKRKEYLQITNEYKQFIKVVEIHNNGTFLGLGRIWNIMALQTTEEIFAMVGDDMIFSTIDWDLEILKEFSKEKLSNDRLKLVYCNDGYKGNLCVNSFIHRRYFDITGIYCREEWKHSFHDNWLMDVFNAIGRNVYLPHVVIRHLHYSIPGTNINKDSVYEKLERSALEARIQCPYNGKDMTKKREDEITLLKTYMTGDIDFSILICSLHSRKLFLDKLIECLKSQIKLEYKTKIQILVNSDNGEKSIGSKRNDLLNQSKGRYIAFIDDDDLVSNNYIQLILNVIDKSNPDVVGIHLLMTTNGQNECRTFHSIKYDHWYDEQDEQRPDRRKYFRCPNHLNPVKREFAIRTKFPEINIGEDHEYSDKLKILLKTEEYIEQPIYYYLYRINK